MTASTEVAQSQTQWSADVEAGAKHQLTAVIGTELYERIRAAKVLVVGAGGIGCEVLKNLAMCGFQNVVVLDFDTIDVSNLNRQFLFRREHIGKSKAEVARESILKMNPNMNITALYTRIEDDIFSGSFMRTFSFVLSALDNAEARRYLNTLCFGAGVPLIESGTQGYLGQCQPILHGHTACYECVRAPAPKTFAICTIRNTPDKPVHCVAWAKLLLSRIFGPLEEDGKGESTNALSDLMLPRWEEFASKTKEEESESKSESKEELAAEFAVHLFEAIFTIETQKQREIEGRWVGRAPPIVLHAEGALDASVAITGEESALTRELKARIASKAEGSMGSCSTIAFADEPLMSVSKSAKLPPNSLIARAERDSARRVLQDPAYYAVIFMQTVIRYVLERESEIGAVSFDKDDDFCMDLVAAASNLRMAAYSIAPLNEFEIKGIAGNIVHAVATTNAIAAGQMVLEAIKLLATQPATTDERDTAITKAAEIARDSWFGTAVPRLISSHHSQRPADTCVCSKPLVTVECNVDQTPIRRLVGWIMRDLGLKEPVIAVLTKGTKYIGLLEDYDDECDSNDLDDDLSVDIESLEKWQQARVARGHRLNYYDRALSSAGVMMGDGSLALVRDLACDENSFLLRVCHNPSPSLRASEVKLVVRGGIEAYEAYRQKVRAQLDREREMKEEEAELQKQQAQREREERAQQLASAADDVIEL